MNDVLAAALELHQSGQLGPAAQLYQKVLFQEQDNAAALHLLGVLHNQQGLHARAVEEISRAAALRPNIPAYHANLAEAYRALGQFERAAGCCRSALRLRHDFPEAHNNLGLARQAQGRHDEAAESFQEALRLRPNFAAALNNLGITRREQGRPEEALELFRRAAHLAPDYPPARTNLGQLLLDRGRPEEALPHCQEAVRLQPDLAPAHHNLGNAYRALGRRVDARSAYLEAIRLDEKLAASYAHLGLVLQQDGESADALPWLKQAVELDPANVDYREHLADLHTDREEHAEAIPQWEEALALAPTRASVHAGLARALHDEGRSEEAVAHYQEALRLNPNHAAARMSLGTIQEENGELTEAEAAYRDALKLQPQFALPHARLGTLLRGKLPADDLAALEARLADPQLADAPRARLLFALGHVLDGRGEHARAGQCLERANALALELNRKHGREYVPADHERFVDQLHETFGPDFFTRTSGWGLETRKPIFVFGLPRSGTTLVEQVLASHSRVLGAGELRLSRQTFETIPAVTGREDGPLAGVAGLDQIAVRSLAECHLAALPSAGRATVEHVADKMPDNYLYLGLLACLFPRATFISVRRDLRDIAVSCWMTDFRSIRWANDPGHIASRFGHYRRLMTHWQAVLPVRVHEIRYERLVDNFEPEARKLLSACGLDWEPACGRFHETTRPVRTASVTQVRQPIYRRGLARWRKYEETLADLFARLPLN